MSKRRLTPINSPPPPLANKTKQQAEDRLRKFKDQAIIFEGESLAIRSIVNRANQRSQIQAHTTSALAWPIQEPNLPTDELDFYDPDFLSDHLHPPSIHASIHHSNPTPTTPHQQAETLHPTLHHLRQHGRTSPGPSIQQSEATSLLGMWLLGTSMVRLPTKKPTRSTGTSTQSND